MASTLHKIYYNNNTIPLQSPVKVINTTTITKPQQNNAMGVMGAAKATTMISFKKSTCRFYLMTAIVEALNVVPNAVRNVVAI